MHETPEFVLISVFSPPSYGIWYSTESRMGSSRENYSKQSILITQYVLPYRVIVLRKPRKCDSRILRVKKILRPTIKVPWIRIQGLGLKVQRFRDSGIQGFKGLKLRKLRHKADFTDWNTVLRYLWGFENGDRVVRRGKSRNRQVSRSEIEEIGKNRENRNRVSNVLWSIKSGKSHIFPCPLFLLGFITFCTFVHWQGYCTGNKSAKHRYQPSLRSMYFIHQSA